MRDTIEYLMDDKIDSIEKIINVYEVVIGDQTIKVTITLDSNGYYQMKTSHIYQAKGKGPYLTSVANFQSEQEALLYAKRQITGTYDGTGVWIELD